ncbi:hypothetical protein HDU98_011901 [Podochytrium sp. JEL0797]|nr:hypothetical protein HDU98_011901 [Podochytrium sp. JEL0797]
MQSTLFISTLPFNYDSDNESDCFWSPVPKKASMAFPASITSAKHTLPQPPKRRNLTQIRRHSFTSIFTVDSEVTATGQIACDTNNGAIILEALMQQLEQSMVSSPKDENVVPELDSAGSSHEGGSLPRASSDSSATVLKHNNAQDFLNRERSTSRACRKLTESEAGEHYKHGLRRRTTLTRVLSKVGIRDKNGREGFTAAVGGVGVGGGVAVARVARDGKDEEPVVRDSGVGVVSEETLEEYHVAARGVAKTKEVVEELKEMRRKPSIWAGFKRRGKKGRKGDPAENEDEAKKRGFGKKGIKTFFRKMKVVFKFNQQKC